MYFWTVTALNPQVQPSQMSPGLLVISLSKTLQDMGSGLHDLGSSDLLLAICNVAIHLNSAVQPAFKSSPSTM